MLMSVLDPRELQASPLADLHALAAELGLEGFRRLRKDDLIKQIVAAGGGEDVSEPAEEEAPDPEVALAEDAATEPEAPLVDDDDEPEPPSEPEEDDEPASFEDPGEPEREEDMRGGILDVLPNGSGFIRAEPYHQSREDVYVSPA